MLDKTKAFKELINNADNKAPIKPDKPNIPDTKKAIDDKKPIADGTEKADKSTKEKSDKREVLAEKEGKPEKKVRERKIQKFMDSFESEFGIPTTRLVEAMSKLPVEKLEQPPEITAREVIGNLNLKDSDQQKATVMYSQLLEDLKQSDISNTSGAGLAAQNEELSDVQKMIPVGAALSQSQQRIIDGKTRQFEINKSIDALNQKFWQTQKRPSDANLVDAANPDAIALEGLSDKLSELDQVLSGNSIPDSKLSDLALQRLNRNVQSGQMQNTSKTDERLLEDLSLISTNNELDPNSGVSNGSETPSRYNQILAALNANPDLYKSEMGNSSKSSGTNAAANIENNDINQLAALLASQSSSDAQFSEEDSNPEEQSFSEGIGSDEVSVDLAAQMKNLKANETQGKKVLDLDKLQRDFFSAQAKSSQAKSLRSSPSHSNSLEAKVQADGVLKGSEAIKTESLSNDSANFHPSDLTALSLGEMLRQSKLEQQGVQATDPMSMRDVNVKQVMDQTQYLVNRGGGEARIKMSPEGLGNLQMNVVVNDGKVNVHLQADSVEAKKLIESSLAELKTSLAAHKLSVENIKIDVVNNTSTDTATGNFLNNGHAGNSGDPGQARQFWNNFHDQFGQGQLRQGYLDVQNPGRSGRSGDKRPLEEVSTQSVQRKQRSDNKGRGLDLVA